MACSDFSVRPYSYDDDCPDDYELKCFRLVQEDTEFRVSPLGRNEMFSFAWEPTSAKDHPPSLQAAEEIWS